MKANQNATLNKDEGGQLTVAAGIIGAILILGVFLLVLAEVAPFSVSEIETANTSGSCSSVDDDDNNTTPNVTVCEDWSAGTLGLWGILGLIVVAGLAMVVLRVLGIV